MKTTFIPVDYNTFDFEGKNYVRIIGRDDKNKRVCIIDKFEPYIWAILRDNIKENKIKKLEEKIQKIEIESNLRITKVQKTEVHNKKFLGKDVKAIKIFITNYKDAHPVADRLDFPEIQARREYDIPLITKYIIDKKISPFSWYRITGETTNIAGVGNFAETCIFADKIEKIEKSEENKFNPKILAYDIEADEFEIGKGEILMISIASEKTKKVLTWKKSPEKASFVEYFKNEEEMLKKFVEYVKKEDPDILVGYFSDGFDLPYLRARCEKHKIKLSLGLDDSQPTFAKGRTSRVYISGIVHVDLFRFIETVYSQYMQSETLGLNEVGLELIGEGKKNFEFKKSDKIKQEEWKDYFEYNLQDSLLTLKLCEKLWSDMLEFSIIIQEPLFDITRDSMSGHVENYVLHNLDKFNEIAEKRPLNNEIEERIRKGKYEGAFVFQPVPGLYENLAFFDFTSMYASVIVTYNLSKSTLLEKKEKDSVEVDLGKEGKVYFSKKQGFFPLMLNNIIEKRRKYKKEYSQDKNAIKKARSNAYKLLANASYGSQGFFGARYYCREAAASTAALARKNILEAIEKIKKNGNKIIYSDTDSISFLLEDKTKKEVLEMLEKINSDLPGIMELDLEDFYKRGLFVSKRIVKAGAKKKYALINEKNEVKIRGFETVRRGWCDLARDLQNEVLELILKNGNEKTALELIKKKVKELKERKVKKEDILIRTQLKKSISEYKAITPHVIAAKKIQERQEPVEIGMLIEYFIAETRERKSLVRDKVKLPDEKGEYNIQYYLEHQIIPAVENILEVFNVNVKEIIDGKKQMKLDF